MDSNILQQASSSTTTTSNGGGGRAIDRHNPIIHDERRLGRTLLPPPSSTPATTPNHHKKKKNSKPKTKNNDQKRKTIAFADENNDQELFTNKNSYIKNPSSSVAVRRQGGVLLGWGCTRPGDFISPATSSRYLLTDKTLSDQFDPLLKLVPTPPPPPLPEKPYKSHNDMSLEKKDEDLLSSPPPKPPSPSPSSLSSRSSDHQVVELRVSLHCRGCERKMRKHISKMEGVSSFEIDFMAKKVTVVGDITPLAVLTSVSKVKNAKLLTPTTISSTPVPSVDSNFSEIKKQRGVWDSSHRNYNNVIKKMQNG